MMNTSKLLMVPPGMVRNDNSAEDNILSSLENEMREILEKKKLPADQKLAEYSQLLHRYMKTNEKRNEPVKIEVQEPEKVQLDDTELLEGIPIRSMKTAKNLLNSIKRQTNIEWTDTGELVVDGMKIDGSNIIDLLHDFSRERKPHNPAVGAEVLARALQKTHVPLAYIGNKYRHKLLENNKNVILGTPAKATPSPGPAKKKRGRIESSPNELDWAEMR